MGRGLRGDCLVDSILIISRRQGQRIMVAIASLTMVRPTVGVALGTRLVGVGQTVGPV